jgi:hypothetical protein
MGAGAAAASEAARGGGQIRAQAGAGAVFAA